MSQADVDRWTPEAKALSNVKLTGRPVRVDVFEADNVASFLRRYWKANDPLPGMEATANLVPLDVADEIDSLVRAIRVLHQDAQLPSPGAVAISELERRGRWLSDRIAKACELVLDDDVQEPVDEVFEVVQRGPDDSTRAARVEYMFALHTIADQVRDRLKTITTFDESWIEELRECANKLSNEGSVSVGRPKDPRVDLRNRMLALLDRRVSRVRQAASYVFDEHPEVLRAVNSGYATRKKLDARRRRNAKKEPTPEPAE